jgi:thiol-disulfide isomerase/thioredoxin
MKKTLLLFILTMVFNIVAAEHDFELYTLEDSLYSLEKERTDKDTKVVVVDFFSIYCEPCKKALPQWEKLYREYAKKGLKFVVVALPVEDDRSAEFKKIKKLFKDGKYSFPVVFDKYSVIAKKYKVVDKKGSAEIPQIFILSKDGKLLKNDRDHKKTIKAVKLILK